MKFPFNKIPHSNLGHYVGQLNLYKMILEESYGFEVAEMQIVFFHPDIEDSERVLTFINQF